MIGLYRKMKILEPAVDEKPIIEIEKEIGVKSAGKIAIIIDDFGYSNDDVSDGFMKLKTKLTYAVIPGHEHSRHMSQKAKVEGFEVIVHMPMETETPSSGEEEYRLKSSMTSLEIEQRVEKVLQHLPEAVGMNNHQGSKATVDLRMMNVLGTVLKRNGKYFLDSRTTKYTEAETVMRTLDVLTGRRNVFLDNDLDEDLIRTQVYELADKAKKYGFAVAIGHARQQTLNVLKREIPELEKQHFEFVYVSEVVN